MDDDPILTLGAGTYAYREVLTELSRKRGRRMLHYDPEKKRWRARRSLQAAIVDATQGKVQYEGLPTMPYSDKANHGQLGFLCKDSTTGQVYDIRRDSDWHAIHVYLPGSNRKDGPASNDNLVCVDCESPIITKQGEHKRFLALKKDRDHITNPCYRCRRATSDPDPDVNQSVDGAVDLVRRQLEAIPRTYQPPRARSRRRPNLPPYMLPPAPDSALAPARPEPDPPVTSSPPRPEPKPNPPSRPRPVPYPIHVRRRRRWPLLLVAVVVMIFVIIVVGLALNG